MKLHALLILGLALVLTACGKKEEAAAPQAVDAPAQEADVEVVVEEAPPNLRSPEVADFGTEAFVRHMHLHAGQLERLNAALAADDLVGAYTPAYWLSRHEGVSDYREDLQQYIDAMRASANAVGEASDLETARAAAKGIEEGCQGCHIETGVDVPGLAQE